ncbi:mannitol dehydrogenase family protein [Microbacterium horticulturae]|uniref:Mannitol-1-phosphate 5-dehydrogenase n=1 Tax=Microbacterium horticulturae TaxID=3028316 RepID=A0ABY8BX93_9MICO|nr:mannitol dehydrogenase family protein [Microbacterium sp. KACC 23027]WEG08796.1 mannitol dehydrogenase family protein [Microbacterium sp. KACC 23027]
MSALQLTRAADLPIAMPGTAPRAGILHLGLGSFHRAHQAVYTAAAVAAGGGDWGIVGVASRSRSIVDAMNDQDMLYSVATISPEGMSLTLPGVHTDAFVGADDPERVVAAIADPTIRVVTLTVTENGYSFSPVTGGLDLDAPEIRADLHDRGAHSTIGQLARGLQQRAALGGAPLTILSCDNLTANGRHTRQLVEQFLHALPSAQAEGALALLEGAVTFPSSMVDRIVPATTSRLRDDVSALLGVHDAVPVPAEPFSMWAIEDDFAAGRPDWDAGGAVFTAHVDQYEQLKVRLLNGTHSLIAYVGALSGEQTIAASVAVPQIERAAWTILDDEYGPSVEVPPAVDIEEYKRQLFLRWGNSALAHRTSQVGTDGSVKLRQRIPEPALLALEQGRMSHMIALTVAAYLSCIAPLPGFDPGSIAQEMKDVARPRLAELAERTHHGAGLAAAVIGDLQLFGPRLAEHPLFSSRVGELIDVIARHGVSAAVEESIASSRGAGARALS